MKRTAILMFKGLYSNQALKALYNLRQSLAPETENRTRLSMTLCIVTLLVLMGFLVTVTAIRKDPKEQLLARGHLVIPTSEMVTWSDDLEHYTLPVTAEGDLKPLRLSATIKAAAFASLLNTDDMLVVSLPTFTYKTLDLTVNNQHMAQFVKGAAAYVYVDRKVVADGGDVKIGLRLVPNPNQDKLIQRTYSEPLFITNTRGYSDFQQTRATANAGRGGFAGLMARIVMAVFVLVLFLFVDGSPESLGMALFLGFEGAALTTSFGWLPSGYDSFIVHYLSQMGDIFRLYFFLQLARLVDKRVAPWFWWGTAASIPYGLVRHFELSLGLQNLVLIPIWRDIIIGFAGALICLRAASAIAGAKLPWRFIALIIAAIGSLQQVVGPIGSLVPALSTSAAYAAMVDIFTPLSVYLLLLSVFINISTLEKRVKSLSQVAINAKEMEREMVLGQAVQASFLRMPETPAGMGVVCHHEPAVYVSGDIYYVHWDGKREILTMLLSDITGHGVQAALKAAVCLTLAESLWTGGEVRQGDPLESRLALYDKRVCSFLTKIAGAPETLALSGMEYNQKTQTLTLYRVNSVFPMIVEAVYVEGKVIGWRSRTLVVPNQSLHSFDVMPGTSVVFLSDGYIGRSRTQLHLQNHLNQELDKLTAPPDADAIKAILRSFTGYDDSHDDRTLLVFQAPLERSFAALRMTDAV